MPTEPSSAGSAATSFVTSADGTRLRLTHWGEGGRDLLLLHGLAEHAGRYEHVAAALVAAGYAVTFLELRGHGHSGGKRGHVMRWSEYVEDVQAAAANLKPGWSMLAHSTGGLVALDAVRAGLAPSRLALSAPLLGARVQAPRIKIAAAGLLSKVMPALSMANEIPLEHLSRDKAVTDAYDKDSLVFRTVTPRWYTEMLAAQQRVLAHRFTLPLAVFVGSDDQITDPPLDERFAKEQGAYFKMYPDFRHEIMNEIGKEQAIADIVGWLEGKP